MSDMSQAIIADTTPSQWLVLRCAPARTIALAAELAHLGAWTPIRTERRRAGRTNDFRPAKIAQMPSFVFVMTGVDLPDRTNVPFHKLRRPDGSPARVRNTELDHLRKIADKPLLAAHELPKVGARIMLTHAGFGGLWAKVLASTQAYATLAIEGFNIPIKIAPCLLPKNEA